ncbi:hypothetical protein G6F59_014436 [Rhizopus arrhizus]|nr:hypothetical protein G6F59_014436 [Rhizopus arrhizus]
MSNMPTRCLGRACQWKTARQIDAKGKYLIPGLWDMHVHFGGGPALIEENKALLPLYIVHGITTVRDCSGDLPEQVLQWRREDRRHQAGLEGHDRSGQRGGRRPGDRPPAAGQGRFREDHRQHAEAGAVPVLGQCRTQGGFQGVRPYPDGADRGAGRRCRAGFDRAPGLCVQGRQQGRGADCSRLRRRPHRPCRSQPAARRELRPRDRDARLPRFRQAWRVRDPDPQRWPHPRLPRPG